MTWTPPRSPGTVERTLFSPAAVGSLLRDEYGFEAADCVLLRTLVNDVYLARSAAGDAVVVKVYRAGHRGLAQVEWEQRLARHVAAKGFRVAEPVPAADGRWAGTIAAAEGERVVAVTRAEPGGKPQPPYTPADITAYGTLIAAFHHAAADFPDLDPYPAPGDPLTALAADTDRVLTALTAHDTPAAAARHAMVAEVSARAAGRLRELAGGGGLRRGVLHGDVSLDNLLVGADGRWVLYDFDLSRPGWLVADLVGVHAADWWQVFADAYVAAGGGLSAVELAALPWLEVAGTISNIAFHLVDKVTFRGVESVAEGWAERDLVRLAEVAGVAELGVASGLGR